MLDLLYEIAPTRCIDCGLPITNPSATVHRVNDGVVRALCAWLCDVCRKARESA